MRMIDPITWAYKRVKAHNKNGWHYKYIRRVYEYGYISWLYGAGERCRETTNKNIFRLEALAAVMFTSAQ